MTPKKQNDNGNFGKNGDKKEITGEDQSLKDQYFSVEKSLISKALTDANGDIDKACQILEIDKDLLIAKMNYHKLGN